MAEPVPPLLLIDTAQAPLEPTGLMPRDGVADLNRRWDADFPGRGGHAVYRIALPPHAGDEPMAVLFSRVGNQVHVQLKGSRCGAWVNWACHASTQPRAP